MLNTRGSLPATTQVSVRVDSLIVQSLKQLAKESDMDFSEYIRMVLSRHTYQAEIAREIKREVFQIREYSQTAISEVYLLKQQVEELEEKLNNFIDKVK